MQTIKKVARRQINPARGASSAVRVGCADCHACKIDAGGANDAVRARFFCAVGDRERARCGRKPWRAWACVQRAARASAHGRRKFIAREAYCRARRSSIDRSGFSQSTKHPSFGPQSAPRTASAVPVPPRRPRASLGRPGPSQNALGRSRTPQAVPERAGRSRTPWPSQDARAAPGRASASQSGCGAPGRPRPSQHALDVPARARRVPERPGRPRTRQAVPERRGRPRTPPRHPGAAGVLERAGAFYGGNPYRTRPYVPGRGVRPRTRPSVPVRACGLPKVRSQADKHSGSQSFCFKTSR